MKHLRLPALALLALAALAGPARAAEPFDPAAFALRLGDILKVESQHKWQQVDWRTDPAAAVAEATKRGVPVLAFLWRCDGARPELACLGARATRGTSHSDPRVIRALNADFVPLAVNCTGGAFPKELPGLKMAETIYKLMPGSNMGFSMSVVLTPDGTQPLACSGDSRYTNYAESVAYDPAKYLRMLAEGRARAAQRAEAEKVGGLPLAGFDLQTLGLLADTDARHAKWDADCTVKSVAADGSTVTMDSGATYAVSGFADRRAAKQWKPGWRVWADVPPSGATPADPAARAVAAQESMADGTEGAAIRFTPLDPDGKGPSVNATRRSTNSHE